MSRVIIVHGWTGTSKSAWIPWLVNELKARDVDAIAPDMPNTDMPKMEEWVSALSRTVSEVNEDTYFVGHSLGGQAVLRYLQTLPPGKRIGGAVFVAAFLSLKPGHDLDEKDMELARPWLETPINWQAVATHTSSFVAIYSDNDPYVPERDAELLKEKLNAKLVLDPSKMHFTGGEGVKELHSVLDELLLIMGLPVDTRPI